MHITSRHNPWFKRFREAIREHAQEIVIEGPKPVADAIANGWTPLAVATPSDVPPPPGTPSRAALTMSSELLEALSETRATQGVIGLFARPEREAASLFTSSESILIALDGVQDPGNTGTIVRLAAAFDAAGILLLPGCADPFAPKAIRSSAGAILSVPIASVSHEELLDLAAEHQRELWAADGKGELVPPPASKAVLVFGHEGSGVSDTILAHARRIAIATSNRVESLNVAMSAAILLSQSFARRTS
jgi:TrmH family RNA methyltransferase